MPLGSHDVPLGFPFYFSPDGYTNLIMSVPSGYQSNANVPVVESFHDLKKEQGVKRVVEGDLNVGITIKECQRLMVLFNARARYERRLFVTAVKVEWDSARADRPEGMTPSQCDTWEENEFIMSVDNLAKKLDENCEKEPQTSLGRSNSI